MRNQVQLITYPDALGGNLRGLGELLDGPLSGLFGGVHILPPFPSSGDRGFAPITYSEIDPAFGSWEEIRLRNEHPAFQEECTVLASTPGEVVLEWSHGGATCRLRVDLAAKSTNIEHTGGSGEMRRYVA